ncbi:MAG: CHAT domain-containing protein [Bacteroidota bacterium]
MPPILRLFLLYMLCFSFSVFPGFAQNGGIQANEEKDSLQTYIQAQINIAKNDRYDEQYESARTNLDTLIAFSREKLGVDHELEGHIFHQLGVLSYVLDDNVEAIKFYKEAARIRKKLFVNNHPDLAQSLHNIGVAYRYEGNFSEAISYLEEAIAIRDALDMKKKQADSYNQLGIVYENIGDYDRSLECTELALGLFRQSVPENEFWYVAQCHRDMGIVLRMAKKPAEALIQFEKAIEIFTDLFGEGDRDVADCYNNLGTAYWEMRQYQPAIEALEKSYSINQKLFDSPNRRFVWNFNNLGLVHMANGNYRESAQYLEKAIKEGQNYYGQNHAELARSFENYGDNAFYQNEFRVALERYQKALVNSFSNFRDSSAYANPDFEKHDIWIEKTELLSFLSNKAKCLMGVFNSGNGNIKDIEAAYETYLLADQLVDLMQKDFREEGSTLILLEKAIPMYENAIIAAIQLSKEKNDDTYKEAAFRLAEKSKAVVLLASIKELKAKDFGGIPNQLLEEENDIRQQLAHQEKLLVNALKGDADAETIAGLRSEILKLKQTYEAFTLKLEQEYPAYHNLKYTGKIGNVKDAREKLLDDQSMLVEYFIGSENVFIFGVSEHGLEVAEIKKSAFPEAEIQWLIEFVSTPIFEQSDKELFNQNAFKAFATLLPFSIPETVKRLTIIPDGVVSYLPFDILLEQNSTGSINFKRLSYLGKKYAIGYGYSATTLIENLERTDNAKTRNVLAMAPIFEESKIYQPLLYSLSELTFLKDQFKTTALEGEQASKSAFIEKVGAFDIIHLSTHAAAEDSLENSAWIAFSEVNAESSESRLSLNDLYALRMKATMVVLSACETARGKIAKGEGVMSLARGFAYAGCQSTVTTLWQVNNQSTADIMERFYNHLEAGLTKDVALKQAKMDYLGSDEIDQVGAHPYYWAAYVPIGNTSALQFGKGTPWFVFPIILVIIILLGRGIKMTKG